MRIAVPAAIPTSAPRQAGRIHEHGEHHGDADRVHAERRDLRDRALAAGMRTNVLDDRAHPLSQALVDGRAESFGRGPQPVMASNQLRGFGAVGPRHRRPPRGFGRVTQRERLERARQFRLDDRHGRGRPAAEHGQHHRAQPADT